MAGLLWISLIWHVTWLLGLSTAILALSAILTVERAPMISFYKWTIHRLFPSAPVVLDANAMRFAHTVGTLFGVACLVLIFTPLQRAGWSLLFFFCLAKTAGALGFCGVTKLYTCAIGNGMNCCGFLKRKNEDA